MKNRFMYMSILLCTTIMLCTGCLSKGKDFRPDQVIENALKNDEAVSYYAEHETVFSENESGHTTSSAKEWFHKDGRMRIETTEENGNKLIVTNDMQTLQIYDTETKELLEGSLGDLEEVMYTPKEEMLMLIDGIQETHTVEYVGEEEIIGRKTHHLKATPRDKSSLNGAQEFWFDAEYWLALKNVSSFGDNKSEINYTHFEIKQDLDEELFTIKKTDDMEVVDLDELSKEHVITLEEMIDRTEQTVWYIPENDSLQIETIEVLEFEEEEDYYTLEYLKDGLPFLSLMIENEIGFMHYDENPETIRVKNQTVYYNSTFDQDVYTWNKDDMQYEIWINDPSITQKEVIKFIKEMEQLKEEK